MMSETSMRDAFLSLFVMGALLSCFVCQLAAAGLNEAPDCVLEAASEGITKYLERIPSNEATIFGFSTAASLEQAKSNPAFGAPLHLRTITPESLRNYSKGIKTKDLLSATPLWYVPVLDGGRIAAFLVVEQSERFPCQAVSFGYMRLASQLEDTLASTEKRENAVLIAVFQAREHFLAYPDIEPDRLYSLKSSPLEKKSYATDSRENTVESVVMRLIPVVNANIQQGDSLP